MSKSREMPGLYNLIRSQVEPQTMKYINQLIALEKYETTRQITMPKITIPMSDEDCHDILNGETFDWTFDGVDVHIKLEDQDDIDETGDIEE